MVSKGHFILHSRAKPPVPAGDYILQGDQRILEEDQDLFEQTNYPTETYQGHIRIESPRYKLQPDQILSTFPPANAVGAFESRLPQMVIKRRTIPWERKVDEDRNIPWLALVVIAEGEGSISAEVPIADCVTPGVTLSGPNDVPTGVYLSVPQTTVNKVFPTKDDLHLLTHVREVDINDTELAIGDDDGFLAVVMANRLPQYDRIECKSVRYLACLVNLEGQLDVLPPPSDPLDFFVSTAVVFNADAQAQFFAGDTDQALMGAALTDNLTLNTGNTEAAAGTERAESTEATARTEAAAALARSLASSPGNAPTVKDTTTQWQTTPESVEQIAISASTLDASSAVRNAMASPFRVPADAFILEKTYRFPVLNHWSFTVDGAGSFETLMEGLDVGMLGTIAGRPSGSPPPDCVVPVGGDAPPDAAAPRREAELAETGHVGLPHRTRRGEPANSWYRGPLVPHLTTRGPATDLAHVSDQLRRIIPDGREDLAEACAFEIGRLLALSQPAVVAALMRWRREQFGAARAKKFNDFMFAEVGLLDTSIAVSQVDTLGPLIGRDIVQLAAAAPASVLGDTRPLVDPGRPIKLPSDDLSQVIAAGFGLETDSVRLALDTGNAAVLEAAAVPVGQVPTPAPDGFAHLTEGLDQVLGRLTEDSLSVRNQRRRGPERAAPEDPVSDRGARALRRLMREAERRARKEIDP